jgi:hypothetical protein
MHLLDRNRHARLPSIDLFLPIAKANTASTILLIHSKPRVIRVSKLMAGIIFSKIEDLV